MTVDPELDHRVGVHRPAQQLELVGVEGDRDRGEAVAEDDGRELAVLAKMGHTLADLRPGRGGQDCLGFAHRDGT
jgi:hypothetical protein